MFSSWHPTDSYHAYNQGVTEVVGSCGCIRPHWDIGWTWFDIRDMLSCVVRCGLEGRHAIVTNISNLKADKTVGIL